MNAATIGTLMIAFFLTAVISVVTGGTSLITVPVMIQCGVEPHLAVATNMLALVFLSLGGTMPFLKSRALRHGRLPWLVALTLVGSVLGSLLLVVIPSRAIPIVVSVAMILVAAFSLANRDAGLSQETVGSSRTLIIFGYITTLLLGIYGGFFSGGYVALLTAAYIAFFRMTFIEAVAVTKLLNAASSLVATAIFAWEGLIDWKLGIVLGVVSFSGAVLGAVLARRMSNVWLRRVFLAAVIILALKTLFSWPSTPGRP
jgi:uncharacterized membrane protein YfcA